MAGCLICVFGSLGEYVLVKVLYSVTEDVRFHYVEKSEFHNEPDGQANGEPIVFDDNGFHSLSHRTSKSARSPAKKCFGDSSNYNHPCHESIFLEKIIYRKLRLPLQWVDPVNGHTILLWKKIDNFSKWFFPLTFCVFCGLYWLILYLHYVATQVQPYSRKFDIHRSSCIE